MKFVTVNIRSLYPSFDEVRSKFNEFDIIGVCETWLNSTYDDNLIHINNYTLFRLDRGKGLPNKRGGGLVVYVGSKFQGHAKQLDDICKITKKLEQLWIILEKPNVRKTAVCIYRPPSGDLQHAISELSISIDYIQSCFDAETIIMGDMNVNYRDRHSVTFDWLKDFERIYNLKQLIKDPTRVTIRSKTTIDLIWMDMNHVAKAGVVDTILSDHMPVFVVKKKGREKK